MSEVAAMGAVPQIVPAERRASPRWDVLERQLVPWICAAITAASR
jgi:hypothetical protein